MIRIEYEKMYNLEDSHWWFLAKRLFIKAVLPQLPQKWEILDFGSGTGGLTSYLSQWGKITGIENSPIGLKYCSVRKLQILGGDINTYIPKQNHYDLVSICDVLYHKHIQNDKAVLTKAYAALKPGGYLIVTDSAIPWLISYHDKLMLTRERYYLKPLTNKIANIGFVIKKTSYIYFFLFWIILLFKKISSLTHTQNVGHMLPVINYILLFICSLEAKLVRHISFPIGSSVLIFAQKPR